MPAATKLPPEHHVVRHVPYTRLLRDGDDNVIGILPQALELRPAEKYLSVTWLEHFASDYEQALSKTADAIGRQRKVGPNSGFAVGGVGQICEICLNSNVKVRVIHKPTKENSGYTALYGLPRDDTNLLGLLAYNAFADTRVAKTITGATD